jgi:hypothetical protein
MNFLNLFEVWELHTSRHVEGKGKYGTAFARKATKYRAVDSQLLRRALFLRNVKRQSKQHRPKNRPSPDQQPGVRGIVLQDGRMHTNCEPNCTAGQPHAYELRAQ